QHGPDELALEPVEHDACRAVAAGRVAHALVRALDPAVRLEGEGEQDRHDQHRDHDLEQREARLPAHCPLPSEKALLPMPPPIPPGRLRPEPPMVFPCWPGGWFCGWPGCCCCWSCCWAAASSGATTSSTNGSTVFGSVSGG